MWTNRYVISMDGLVVTTWEPSWWRSGGSYVVDGQPYTVSSNAFGSTYQLVDAAGVVAAVARRVGRKHWTVETVGRTYEFRRPSMWRHEEELVVDGQRAGSIRRLSMWRNDAVADLPGLPPAVQVFVLCVLLTTWDASDATAAAT